MLHSYSKVYALGHPYLAELFLEECLVEEKIDGSQFSFGIIDGELVMRSKGAQIFPPVEDKLFKAAAEYIQAIKDRLEPGVCYRGEVLWREKHNEIEYGRIPKHSLILFDIDAGEQNYLSAEDKAIRAEALDLEIVPSLFRGKIDSIETLRGLLATISFLSEGEVRPKVEGIVIKNYKRFGIDKKTLMGKWVREEFKETQKVSWRAGNPTTGDVIEALGKKYRSEVRWKKAIYHLRDSGSLMNSPQDIGVLIKEIQRDVEAEEATAIKDALFLYAMPKIRRISAAGFPEWYKEYLAESMFEEAKNVPAGIEKTPPVGELDNGKDPA